MTTEENFLKNGYTPISISNDETIYKRYDPYQDCTFYQEKILWGLDDNVIESYFVEQGDNLTYHRLKLYYKGSSWIFFTKAIIINDSGDRMEFSFDSWDMNRKVRDGGYVSESIDKIIDENTVSQLLIILKNSNGIINIRLSGKDGSRDYQISNDEINGLINILSFKG
jgi:hypothetical protein